MSTSWNPRTKPETSWDEREAYLLQENSYYLLLESGFKILINGVGRTDWTDRNKPNTNWTPRVQP